MGVSAERLVQERIAAALPDGARCYPNVRFIARSRERGPAHDGEADVAIVDPSARHRHAAGARRAPSSARRPPVIVVRPGTARDSLGGTDMPHGSYDTTSPGVERATRSMSREAHR